MAPLTNAFNRLSFIGRRKDKKEEPADLIAETIYSSKSRDRPGSVAYSAEPDKNSKDDDCGAIDKPVLVKDPGPYPSQWPGVPCRKDPVDPRLKCHGTETESINTFLRPDNLLMTEVNLRENQTKPYLVGNKLMREIPIRDPTRQLTDKELRCLHWVVGESVERHAERTARYFANLFRSRELTDVIIYVGEHKVKTHKLVLAAFSPRFNKQFMKERPEHLLMPEVCIDVSQLQTRALLRCIEFMYKGTTEIHHYNAAEILNVAQALKVFSLAQMCKDKLKSLQFSDLIFKPPQDKCDAVVGELSRARQNEEVKPNKLAKQKSEDNVNDLPCHLDKRVCINPEDIRRQEEAKAMSSGPVDFYRITGQSTFLAWPVETVEALFGNDDLKLNSELDIVEAMVTWIQFRPEQRRQYAERLLDQVRFIHTTPHEMLDCKHLIPELFDMGPLRTRMSKAKWTKDLVERGMAPADVVIPVCRVNREGYWVEPDPCQTPLDNIYGVDLPQEYRTTYEVGHRPQAQAARGMVSNRAHMKICDQIERIQRMEDSTGNSCSTPGNS